MSRHHLLPPLTYVPPPQPKKVANRKRRIDADEVGDAEEVLQTHEATGTGRPTALGNKLPPPAFPAIEASDRKPPHPGGRLSESTLTAMLQAQELK